MKIESARYEGGELILKVPALDGRKFAYGFKPGEYEIKKARNKRSDDANAYAWVLLNRLAEATRIPADEIYRETIRKIGGVSDIVCVPDKAVKKLCESWGKGHIGWQTETDKSKIPGCTNVILYYGSSTYDTAQMSRLIDSIVEDCRALDVETRPEEEIQALLKQWECKNEP